MRGQLSLCAVGWVAQLAALPGLWELGGGQAVLSPLLCWQVLQEGTDQRAAGVGVHSLHQADTILRATM